MEASRAGKKQRRHQRIIAALAASPTVRISTLAEEFGVSTETVRRDIDELTRRGLVDRTYGGASARHIGFQPAFGEREGLAVEERQRMGRAAAALVKPGDVLMIDSGSTTTQFARALAAEARNITVITNSQGVANALVDIEGARVVFCPGDFSGRERGVYGPETVAFLNRFYADVAFIGASGLTPDGPTDVVSEACWVKRSMVDRASRSVLLVDSSKFGQKHLEIVCPLARLSGLVTDAAPTGALAQAVAAAGIELRVAT
jgi:DeoR/GlpR family transcriptional regulator of sugar metabolism